VNSPTSSDSALSQAMFLEQWPELLARVRGLRIFARGDGRMVHAKVAVFDREIAVVGTYNLDPVSMGINSEVMIVIRSEDFARSVLSKIRADQRRGPPIFYEYEIARDPDGAPRRDGGGLPIVQFGPENHTDPAQWRKVRLLRALLPSPG
jgi:cardiolipin synthase C